MNAVNEEEASVGESLVDSPTDAGSPTDEIVNSPIQNNSKLEAEISELKDKNLRLYAEFENFRKRASKESFELIITGNARLIGKLTEVLDNFQRAFDPKNRTAAEEFEKGIKLIHARLREILEEEGLEEIDPAGSEFDPNLHEALMLQASDTVPENRILQTVQKGYKLKTKIISHAKVVVSKGKEG